MKVIKPLCYFLMSCCATFSLSAWATQFAITNQLPANSGCPNGNTITVFYGDSQQTVNPGNTTAPIEGDFSQMPGLGIQVNNWYWIQTEAPPQKNPQNPDNSGAQFAVSDDCVITSKSAAWFGSGIQTYRIANVDSAVEDGICVITISANNYTNAVTPNCCAPPIFSSNVCTGPYGVTNTGQSWPPP